MESPALSFRSVRKRYGSVIAVDGLDLEIAPGECVALVGESGSGKTTLLRMANALVIPDAGTVDVDGERVDPGRAVELRRRMGYVPQEGGLLPHWRVLRNVALVPWLLAMPDPHGKARAALHLVGLDPGQFEHRWPDELSGGQRQRVALARALAAQPKHLLLDEAFGALDAITRAEVREAFARLRNALHVTTLLVTHDLGEAALLADRIAVMRGGRLEQAGTPAQVARQPATEYVRHLVERATAVSTALHSSP